MVFDTRLDYVRKWLLRAEGTTDNFDKFFYAWIALTIAAQRLRTNRGMIRDDDTDRYKIVDYFKENQQQVLFVLKINEARMQQLATRRGERFGNAIVDVGNPELREKFSKLSKYYKKIISLTDEEIAEYSAELFNKIRNNLFHGLKVYDNREDIAIIQLVSPILVDIVKNVK